MDTFAYKAQKGSIRPLMNNWKGLGIARLYYYIVNETSTQ